MVKIAGVMIDPQELYLILPYESGCALRFRSGASITIDMPMEEMEEELMRAGLLEPPPEGLKMCEISEAELDVLMRLSEHYEWLARDNNGNLYAYAHKPSSDGVYWSSDGDERRLDARLFGFVSEDDAEPTSIAEILESEG